MGPCIGFNGTPLIHPVFILLGCAFPVGLENGNLPDARILSSSAWGSKEAPNARLFGNSFWRPEVSDAEQFLEMVFDEFLFVTFVETQGGYATSLNAACFVKTYALAYKDTSFNYRTYGGKQPKVPTVEPAY